MDITQMGNQSKEGPGWCNEVVILVGLSGNQAKAEQREGGFWFGYQMPNRCGIVNVGSKWTFGKQIFLNPTSCFGIYT